MRLVGGENNFKRFKKEKNLGYLIIFKKIINYKHIEIL